MRRHHCRDDVEVLFETGDPRVRITSVLRSADGDDRSFTILVDGELCLPGADDARPLVTEWYRQASCSRALLDLTEVTFIDARGLHLLIVLQDLGDELGRPLLLAEERMSRCVARLLTVCGLTVRGSALVALDPIAAEG